MSGKLSSSEVISSSGLFMSKMHGPYFLIAPIHIPFLLQVSCSSTEGGGEQRKIFQLQVTLKSVFLSSSRLLSLLSLSTPAARKCSLQRSKQLSPHLDLQWSITVFALAKADKICRGKVMSYCHIQLQKIQGIHLVEMGKNQSLWFFFHNTSRSR